MPTEYELRINRVENKRIVPGLDRDTFYRILQEFKHGMVSKDIIEKYSTGTGGSVRRITSLTGHGTKIEHKKPFQTSYEDFGVYSFKYTKSSEDEVEWMPGSRQVSKFTRIRISFQESGCKVEFTIVNKEYQLEVEFDDGIIDSVVDKIKGLLGIRGVCKDVYMDLKKRNIRLVNPTNVKKHNLPDMKSYKVTNKLNGVRRLLIIHDDVLYDANPILSSITKMFTLTGIQNMTIECEQYFGQYHMYDIVGSDDYHTVRLDTLHTISRILNGSDSNSNSLFVVKTFVDVSQLDSFLPTLYGADGLPNMTKNDGLIFTSQRESYDKTKSFKWKWPEELTIDFRTIVEGDKVLLKYYDGHEDILFQKDGFSGIIDNTYGIQHNMVSEFSWNAQDQTFVFVRSRTDKTNPNYKDTVLSVWEDIHNPILQSSLLEHLNMKGKNKYLRDYHNSVKKSLLSRVHGSVLDIGFGVGGDYQKYTNTHIYAVEPYDSQIEKFHVRHPNPKDITIIPTSGVNTDMIKQYITEKGSSKTKAKFGVSMFSLTFFFDSEKTIRQLVETIDTCVSDTFLGVTLDGDAMEQALVGYDTRRWGENIVVHKEYEDSDTFKEILFTFENAKSVDTQKEYLVKFDLFTQLMEEKGFVLESSTFLNPPFQDEDADYSRLNRTFIFNRYHAEHNVIAIPLSEYPILSCVLAHTGIDIRSNHQEQLDAFVQNITIEKSHISMITEHDPIFNTILSKYTDIPIIKNRSIEYTIMNYLRGGGGLNSVANRAIQEYIPIFRNRIYSCTPDVLQFLADTLFVTIIIDDVSYIGGDKGREVLIENGVLHCNMLINETDFTKSMY